MAPKRQPRVTGADVVTMGVPDPRTLVDGLSRLSRNERATFTGTALQAPEREPQGGPFINGAGQRPLGDAESSHAA
jgi:hypothetical protein